MRLVYHMFFESILSKHPFHCVLIDAVLQVNVWSDARNGDGGVEEAHAPWGYPDHEDTGIEGGPVMRAEEVYL